MDGGSKMMARLKRRDYTDVDSGGDACITSQMSLSIEVKD